MRNKLGIQFSIQGAFFIGAIAIWFRFGGPGAIHAMMENAPNILNLFLSGVFVSLASSLVLFSKITLGQAARLAIFVSQLLLSFFALLQGSVALIAAPFPAYYAYKYWREGNA